MHEIDVLFYGDAGLTRELCQVTDAEFLHYYRTGLYNGCPIVSMTWTHKNETHKLIFGD